MPFERPVSAWLVSTRFVKPEGPPHSLGESCAVCRVPIARPVPRLFGDSVALTSHSRLSRGVKGW